VLNIEVKVFRAGTYRQYQKVRLEVSETENVLDIVERAEGMAIRNEGDGWSEPEITSTTDTAVLEVLDVTDIRNIKAIYPSR
jgi:hypothetical protein